MCTKMKMMNLLLMLQFRLYRQHQKLKYFNSTQLTIQFWLPQKASIIRTQDWATKGLSDICLQLSKQTSPFQFFLNHFTVKLKETVHPKRKILLSFTHPHVPNLYDFLLLQEHKRMIQMCFSKKKKKHWTSLTLIKKIKKKQPKKNVKTFLFF